MMRLSICLIFATTLIVSGCQPFADERQVLERWQKALPSTPFEAARRIRSFDRGLFELRAGDTILYGDADGRILFIGHLYEPGTNTDLTQVRKDELLHQTEE